MKVIFHRLAALVKWMNSSGSGSWGRNVMKDEGILRQLEAKWAREESGLGEIFLNLKNDSAAS